MEDRSESSVLSRFVERRVRRKGLRPRVAAGVIALAWVIAIVVFGVVERLVDPDTFDNVWLGMWWATQTVTTVGFGDVVPDSTVGQLFAAVLMVGGLSFFAVITGMITSIFVARIQAETGAESDQLALRVDEALGELKVIRSELARLHGDEPGERPRG
jgi:voltage-gated potassium channel Kch